jgi:hypothetical protein
MFHRMQHPPFKTCPYCSKVWNTLEDFLSDPELELAGYQVAFEDLEGGLFFFTHIQKNCGTTLAIKVRDFISLSSRPIVAARTKKPEGCSNLCVRQGALEPCPIECECVWVREILQVIRSWKKRAA